MKRYVFYAVLNLPSPCVIECDLDLLLEEKEKETSSLCPLHCNCIKKHKTASQYKKKDFKKYTVIYVKILKCKGEIFGENGSGLHCESLPHSPSQKTYSADIRTNSATSSPRKAEKSGRLKPGTDEQNSTLNSTVLHPEVL